MTGGRRAAAADLIDSLGGRTAWAQAVGAVPQATHAVTKLRWLARTEPAHAARIAEIMQPHDWLAWQLLGRPARRTTDRGGASATGFWSAATESYRPDLVELALGHQVRLPEVLSPSGTAGFTPEGLLISAGTGETMAAAFGLGVGVGDAVVSLGASGSVFGDPPRGAGGPDAARSPRSRTRPAGICRWCTPATRYGCCAVRRRCWGRTWRACPSWR